jgi:hypothetical protein
VIPVFYFYLFFLVGCANRYTEYFAAFAVDTTKNRQIIASHNRMQTIKRYYEDRARGTWDEFMEQRGRWPEEFWDSLV